MQNKKLQIAALTFVAQHASAHNYQAWETECPDSIWLEDGFDAYNDCIDDFLDRKSAPAVKAMEEEEKAARWAREDREAKWREENYHCP